MLTQSPHPKHILTLNPHQCNLNHNYAIFLMLLSPYAQICKQLNTQPKANSLLDAHTKPSAYTHTNSQPRCNVTSTLIMHIPHVAFTLCLNLQAIKHTA